MKFNHSKSIKFLLLFLWLLIPFISKAQGALDSAFNSISKDSANFIQQKIKNSLKSFNKKVVANPELSMGLQSMYQNRVADSSNWQGIANIGIKFNTFGLPINFNLASKILPQIGYSFDKNQLFNFKYQDQLSKYKSRDYLNDYAKSELTHRFETLKTTVQQKMGELMQNNLPSNLRELSIDLIKLKELLVLPEIQLKPQIDKLVESGKKKIIEKLPWDNRLSEKKDSIQAIAKAYQSEIYLRISDLKNKLKGMGITDSNIKNLMDYSEGKLDDEQFFAVLFQGGIEGLTGNSGFANLYQNIKDFNIGQFSQKLPFNNLNREQFLNGFQIALKSNRGPINLGFAKESNISGLNEAEFNQSAFSPSKYLGFIKATVINGIHSKGAVSFAGTSTAYSNDAIGNNGPSQSSYALGIEQNFKLEKGGEFKIEINKSFSKYKDAVITDYKGQFVNDNTFNQLFGNDFDQTLSGGIYHKLDLPKAGLNSNLYFNYSGSQFQNPGNSAFNQPRMRWGGKFKKSLFEDKLSFSARLDHRSSSYGEGQGWKNQLMDLDSRIRVNRKTNLSFKYQENSSQSLATLNKEINLNSETKKYQITGNTRFKFLMLNVNTQFNAALQDIKLPGQLTSRNMMFTFLNTFSFGKQSMTASLFINRDKSLNPLIGNLLNGDLAWQYLIAKYFFLSTGVTYVDNQNMLKQIGGKQTLQFTGAKNLEFNVFFDLRKNLIQPVNPFMIGTSRGEIAMVYHLKTK